MLTKEEIDLLIKVYGKEKTYALIVQLAVANVYKAIAFLWK